ncbi:MAG: hypothetical protein IK058_02055 [Bacteroidales bacterium]|nr:hypothetical protein [Bacteroidales bacterium]
MDKKAFNERVAHCESYTSQDRGWLRAIMAKYPYSSVVNVLALLADHAYGFDTPEQRRAVALSMCDAQGLNMLLANAKQKTVEVQNFDILSEINTFQEVSFKTAPKSVILSNFLQIATSETPESGDVEPLPAESSDKKSLAADVSLGTETLAIILEKQGKYDKALAIYENLLARNPEKSSNFAPRIERLKEMLNNK